MNDSERPQIEEDQVRSWLVNYISGVLDIPKMDFPIEGRFDSYGLDSVEAVIMAGVLEEDFRVPVDPMELFEHPSVKEFASAFVERNRAKA